MAFRAQMTGGRAERPRWNENGAARTTWRHDASRVLSSEDTDKSVFAAWAGELTGCWWWWYDWFIPQSCDLQAFDNASILEGALGVHGHAVQSSAVSLPLLLRIVCVLFPSVTGENLCLLVRESRGSFRCSDGRRLGKPLIKSGNENTETGDKSRLSCKPTNTCFIITTMAATASF